VSAPADPMYLTLNSEETEEMFMKYLRNALLATAGLLIFGASAVQGCTIRVIVIQTDDYIMLVPVKGNGSGGGGPFGPGIGVGGLDGFNNVVFQYFGASSVFPTATPTGFTVDFTVQNATVTADNVTIPLTNVSGAWTFNVNDQGPVETFTAPTFSLSGTGVGSDGIDYQASFKANGGLSGTFAPSPIVTSGHVGDPVIDIASQYTASFFDVFASLAPVGGNATPVSKGNLTGVQGCTTCTVELIPEVRTGWLVLSGLAILGTIRASRSRLHSRERFRR
jgi:hypothetical protein